MSALSPGASFNCMVAPERIAWCCSQWQPSYSELLMTIPGIEFFKGIPGTLEQDLYFDDVIRN